MYSGSARLVSFEIKLISKEISRAEPEYMNIHPPISVLPTALGKAGIDTIDFKAHSTRSASTSRALSGGVSLEEVLKMADWSGPSTLNRFYYRPRFDNAFRRSVLESAE